MAVEGLNGTVTGESDLSGNLSISTVDVPYYEVSNNKGGVTVYIGGEVPTNGL